MLSLASHAAEGASRLQIGGISVHRSPSPTFKLKIETNLDVDGNCEALDKRQEEEAAGLWHDQVIASKRIQREQVQLEELLGQGAFGQVIMLSECSSCVKIQNGLSMVHSKSMQ
ncbi:hypothetical protein KRP22_005145 [Phytophthora ramorum]|nr:hypothetical protein KRP22_12729 [Phytophthora ramorum]